jgi:regulator of telomere elongation helicase 1
MKKRIMNDTSQTGKAGEEWYKMQAYRAVNQAIGRVIRHKNDYGAVLLCDERFAENSARSKLPKWIRPLVKVFRNFQETEGSLEQFFRRNQKSTPVHGIH